MHYLGNILLKQTKLKKVTKYVDGKVRVKLDLKLELSYAKS